MKLSLLKTILSGFILALLLLCGIALSFYSSMNRIAQANNWQIHTYQVLESLQSLEDTAIEAQRIERGYVITGEARQLGEYESRSQQLTAQEKNIRLLTKDNPKQQRHLDATHPVIQQTSDFMQQVIDTRKAAGFNAAKNLLETNTGNRLIATLLTDVKGMRAEENSLLVQRKKILTRSLTHTAIIGLVGFALIVTILLGLYAFIRREIKSRWMAEASLKKSEERLYFALEGANDGLWDWNPITGDIYYSPKWYEILGYQPGEIEMSSSGWQDLIHPDDFVRVSGRIYEHLQGTNPTYESETRLKTKSGSWRWVRTRGKIVERLESGQACRMVGTISNIDEERRAVDTFRLLFECSSDPHLIFNEFGILDCNDATARLLYAETKEQLFGLNPALISPEFQPDGTRSEQRGNKRIEEALETGFARFDWLHQKLNGEQFPVEVSLTRIILNERPALLCVWHDLTERKMAETKIRNMSRQNELILNAAGDGIFGLSPDGLITFINPAAAEMFGYSVNALLGTYAFHDLLNHVHADGGCYAKEDSPIYKALQSGIPVSTESEVFWHQDGSTFPVEYNATPIREGDDVVGIVVIFKDIAARKRMEETMMEATEAALQADRLKSEFLATMSHEIRTPMNGVLGLTEMVLKTELTIDQRKNLQMVQNSGQSLLTVINDVLDFSKIEAGKMEIDPIAFKLRESVAEILNPLSQIVRHRKLELLYRVHPEVPNNLIGDPPRLRQILNNLIGNALKFTHEGEVLLDIEKGAEEGMLHFRVSDTGIGMTAAQLSHIFQPFRQADGSTTRRYGGTGLGLSISKSLIELMGGSIWVESAEGEGSTFHFTARFEVPDRSSDPILPVDIGELVGVPVLVVDDNDTNLYILQEILTTYKMIPTTVASPIEALRMIREAAENGHPYPLSIMDVQMPEMDGFTLAETVKSDPALASMRVILLTSCGEPGDGARCRESNLEGYLNKPAAEQTLIQTIQTVLSHRNTHLICYDTPITKHYLRENFPRLRVLLAEDNKINQIVAENILKDEGYSIIIANDGLEAVNLFQKQKFDLILMDVHMPEMDGYEATEVIRRLETPGHRIPIIALTANALKGDRDRCLEAGMDGYVSKPFKSQDLIDVINAHTSMPESRVQELQQQFANVRPEATDVLDREKISERVNGNMVLLKKVISLFVEQYPVQLSDIETAIRDKNGHQLSELAHSLKGTIGNFSEKSAYSAAAQLEVLGTQSDFEQSRLVYKALCEEVEGLSSALQSFAQEA